LVYPIGDSRSLGCSSRTRVGSKMGWRGGPGAGTSDLLRVLGGKEAAARAAGLPGVRDLAMRWGHGRRRTGWRDACLAGINNPDRSRCHGKPATAGEAARKELNSGPDGAADVLRIRISRLPTTSRWPDSSLFQRRRAPVKVPPRGRAPYWDQMTFPAIESMVVRTGWEESEYSET